MKKTIKNTPKKNIVRSSRPKRATQRKVAVEKFAEQVYRDYGDVLSRLAHE